MSVSTKALLPGQNDNGQQTTLGVMGGGQLGRMFVHAAQAMGYFTAVLDPDTASPAGRVLRLHQPLRSESASQVRDAIRSGQSWQALLPPAVAGYIADRGLYGASST